MTDELYGVLSYLKRFLSTTLNLSQIRGTRIMRRYTILSGTLNLIAHCLLILSGAFAQAAGVTSIEPPNPTTKDNVYLHHTFGNYYPNTVDELSLLIDGSNINVYAKLTTGLFPPPVETPVTVPLGRLKAGVNTVSIWAAARNFTDVPYGDTYLEDRVTLTVTQVPQSIAVVEFYHDSLKHYFMSADRDEIALLDGNVATLGWQRTGAQFNALTRETATVTGNPVCRFYGSVTPGPNSHFYTAFTEECEFLKELQAKTPSSVPRWNYEAIAFVAILPQKEICPAAAPIPIYRLYNNRSLQNDSNHRYVRDRPIYETMISGGWLGEGVVMCALPD